MRTIFGSLLWQTVQAVASAVQVEKSRTPKRKNWTIRFMSTS
jgi:hypothetical protein